MHLDLTTVRTVDDSGCHAISLTLLLLLLLQGSTVPNGTMVVGGHDDIGLTTYIASSWRGSYTPVPGHLFSKSHYRRCSTLS
eukprot:COSAG02_NODE_38321_length_430_cov_1.196375_1_plen_81_part_10